MYETLVRSIGAATAIGDDGLEIAKQYYDQLLDPNSLSGVHRNTSSIAEKLKIHVDHLAISTRMLKNSLVEV